MKEVLDKQQGCKTSMTPNTSSLKNKTKRQEESKIPQTVTNDSQ
jgi:hypothetical protein